MKSHSPICMSFEKATVRIDCGDAMHNKRKTLDDLIASRRKILEFGDGWTSLGDQEIDLMMAELNAVERDIVAAPCVSEGDKLRVLSVLLDSNDDPGFADNFKNDLFLRLRGLSC